MYRKLALTMVVAAILGSTFAMGSWRAAAADNQSVSFYYYGDPAEEAVYKQLVDAFNKKYPDIEVKQVLTPGEDEFRFGDEEDAYKKRLTLDFTSKTPPDVFLIPYREYPIFAERAVLEPVAPYLAKSSVIKADDFYPQALKSFTLDSVLNCIPQNLSGTVVYYNKALFDKAGVAYPKAGWTWTDFLNAAKALTDTKDSKDPIYGLGTNVEFNRLLPFIWQNGGEIVDNYDDPSKLTLDTPEVKEAFEYFVNLRKAGVTPDEAASRIQSNEDRFLTGKLGMLLFSRRITPTLRKAAFDWDVAPLPTGKKDASLLYSDGYCMAKDGKNKDAAWKLVEFANSEEGQTILAKSGRSVPSLKSVAQSAAFLDPNAKPKNSQLFLDLIPTLRSVPTLMEWEDVQEALNEQVEQAFYDGKEIDEAINEAIEESSGFFK